MSELSSEEEPGLADRLNDSLINFTACVGGALNNICTYSLTIGDSYVPFNPDEDDDCDEEDAACSQAWVRVDAIVPAYTTDSFGGDCGSVLSITLEVGVIRCTPIPDEGEAPTASEVMAAAFQAMEDMNALYCAMSDCDAFDQIRIGSWSPFGPLGGQYGGTWTVTVEF